MSDEFAVREIRTYSESRGGAVSELFFVRLSLQNEGRYYCTWKTLSDSRYLRVVGGSPQSVCPSVCLSSYTFVSVSLSPFFLIFVYLHLSNCIFAPLVHTSPSCCF